MELGLHPKRQKWYIERFIIHGWPRGEHSHKITPAPKRPQGLSIWRKLLLPAAYEDICHVTGQWRATDHHRLCRSGDTSHRKVLVCGAIMCVKKRRKLEYIKHHADVDTFSLMSALSDPISLTQIYKTRMCTHPECKMHFSVFMCYIWACVHVWFCTPKQVGNAIRCYILNQNSMSVGRYLVLWSLRVRTSFMPSFSSVVERHKRWGRRGKGGWEEYDLSLTLLDESALGG